jgi:hypothetical protein
MWHLTAQRPKLFAATASLGTPLWNSHGNVDKSVPVEFSRERIAALRKAGGRPIYNEYAGVEHHVAVGIHRAGAAEVGVLAAALLAFRKLGTGSQGAQTSV